MVSRVSMRRVLIALCLLSSGVLAQSASSEKHAIIERTKKLMASSFDSRLPSVPLEYFLNYENSGANIVWEVNDCGGQAARSRTDAGRDFPICVEADFDANHYNVTLMFAVGTLRTGTSRRATLFSAVASDVGGKTYPMRQLGDLPEVVHHPVPRQTRDPGAPTNA